jgi:hypothetical protein
MTQEVGARPEMSAWRTNLLRLSTFHDHQALVDLNRFAGAWKSITGSEPETATTKVKTKQIIVGGPLNGALLVMHIQALAERIDWFVVITPDGHDPALDSLSGRLGQFRDLMDIWLRDVCPDLKRIALGVDASHAANSLNDAYALASQYVYFEVDTEIASDFLYQANRRRPSGVLNRKLVNRLIKCSVGEFNVQTFRLQPDGVVSLGDTSDDLGFHCRIELDVNTMPGDASGCPKDRLPDLLRELSGLAERVFISGESS